MSIKNDLQEEVSYKKHYNYSYMGRAHKHHSVQSLPEVETQLDVY